MQFTDQNFQKEVEEAKGLILVDFFAEWCGPCKLMGPVIEELIEEYKNKEGVKIGKLNVDENRNVVEKYNIMGIPTLVLFKDGKIVAQEVGHHVKDEIQELINKNL